MKPVCIRCQGKGSYLGLGMIVTECNLCNNDEPETPSLDKIDRNSKSYKKAVKDIMNLNPEITHKEAVKIFDEAYVKS